jgi:hypothetical protein
MGMMEKKPCSFCEGSIIPGESIELDERDQDKLIHIRCKILRKNREDNEKDARLREAQTKVRQEDRRFPHQQVSMKWDGPSLSSSRNDDNVRIVRVWTCAKCDKTGMTGWDHTDKKVYCVDCYLKVSGW